MAVSGYTHPHTHVPQIRYLSIAAVAAGSRNVCFVYVRGEHIVFINIVFVLSENLYLKVISFLWKQCDPDGV